MKSLIIASLILLLAMTAHAATWRVELDGSGDYTSIQDAVDVAVSGDTVLIGPGRWDQFQSHTVPGWTSQVIVVVNDKDLTLIGSGQGVTIIGPEVAPPFYMPGPIGITMTTDFNLTVQDLTIENLRNGLYFWGDRVEAINVQFAKCYLGSSPDAIGGGTYIDCRFDYCTGIGLLASSRANGMLVQNCRFESAYSRNINLQNVENILIDGCQFFGGLTSIQFDGPASYGTIRNCVMSEGRGPYFDAVSGSQMELIDNEAYGGRYQVSCTGYATVSGSGNLFNGTDDLTGNERTISCYTGFLDLHNSHIFRGTSQYAVYFQGFSNSGYIEQYIQNNYWGTEDADSVAAWIRNEDDDPSMNIRTFIEPYDRQPIPNKNLSFGEVKKIYR